MSDISALENKIDLKTFLFLLFNFVTVGHYAHIWLYKTSTVIEEITQIRVMGNTFLIVYLSVVGLGGLLVTTFGFVGTWLAVVWYVSAWLITVLWCFRARNAIRMYALTHHGFAPRINRVLSVLFTFYHVNYCINALARDKEIHEENKRKEDQAVSA